MDVAASEFQTEDKMYDLKFKEKDNDGSGKKTGCVCPSAGAVREQASERASRGGGAWRDRPVRNTAPLHTR
jgi:hypothetical protein